MSDYNVRQLALDVLVRIGDQGGYSHLLIDQLLKKHRLESRDSALLTELVYGTLQRKLTLSYDLDHFVPAKKKVDRWVKWLIWLTFYQMKYLDRVPDHAAIHQAVEIAKYKGHKGIANFVNGVLRSAQRQGFPDYQKISEEGKRISVETSHPEWLVQRWLQQYGRTITEKMCQINMTHKQISIRVQPLRIAREELMIRLQADGLTVEPSVVSPQGIIVNKGNVLKQKGLAEGLFTIQDESSMLVAELMDLSPEMTILDACSAPGGKATHIAEKMIDQGVIYAYDLHQKKVRLVQQKAELLGLTSIQTNASDARMLQTLHQAETFDRILIDAPCSGLGVLRSKPDIRYHKTEQDVIQLARIQGEILEQVEPLLKKGGKLIYSTCTVDKEENEQVIQAFLQQHENYQVDPAFFMELPEFLQRSSGRTAYGLQIFPQDLNSDGFFITRLVRADR
ncbi:16S rRNA (cytosine(967)-C(5))-methyltransferase RsmB [Gracilibacillus alcaliphilus]|uniref:16S rRNA (cytosine(967)-C(5))-methyltransferase RsmB n=1 Tax=Gracilibacillus alcaliphilus TaxID=1401441 RepID=UPI00195D448F|nr:16S rRNA (cytosine(967)-C(5))-methyltransferase RsmB [Gracilibacillus alcaliphilus]MBM7678340.1 16S rRNA (cytosine967-C5)-methyltransferase [Gracilibacillus alcaliphilus]